MSNGSGKGSGVKPGPAASREIDLDQKRAARAEKHQEPVLVRFGGQEFTLPAELPLDFVELVRDGKFREGFSVLFGDGAEAFFAQNPSIDDLNDLSVDIGELYGVKTGEALASPNS